MIQIHKDGETRNCHKSELKRMVRQGWEAQEESNPDPETDTPDQGDKNRAPEVKQEPKKETEPAPKTQATKPDQDNKEEETVLYKRLKGEWVEGMESPENVIINEEKFPDELLDIAIEEGWYKTKDEAATAPPDKQMSETK